MNILWLSWKDERHPLAGGAETVSTELRKSLVADGHHVTLITARYKNSTIEDQVAGVRILRVGGRYSVYIRARQLFRKKLKNWPDLIIDEMNTIPFMGFSYRKEATAVLLTYQLARQVWFYQMPRPLSYIGYVIEPLYLRYIAKKYSAVLTESTSTKDDLLKFGFQEKNVQVFRVGMHTRPQKHAKKLAGNRLVFLGSVRPMKRTLDAIQALEHAKAKNPALSLDVVGDYSGSYGQRVRRHAQNSRFSSAIHFHGKVSKERKEEILQNSDLIVITSVKEGWGLIATEAAAHGIPAVGYDVDGLRDSIIDGKTGLLCRSGDTEKLGELIVAALEDRNNLQSMGKAALENSRQYTFENCYTDFKTLLTKAKILHGK